MVVRAAGAFFSSPSWPWRVVVENMHECAMFIVPAIFGHHTFLLLTSDHHSRILVKLVHSHFYVVELVGSRALAVLFATIAFNFAALLPRS